MIKMCTGCGRLNDEPLGLNKNGEPYLACCPDNNYREIGGVEWLIEQVKDDQYKRANTPAEWAEIYKKAKAIQKQNMIDFAIAAYQDISELMGVEFHKISENKLNFENYFNERLGG
jgi:hypothetical protein